MVNEIRTMEKMLGKKEKIISREENQKIPSLRRYLVVKNDIKKGEKFTKDNLGFYRIQGNKNSLEPKYFESILGRMAKKKIFSQTPLKNKHFK